MIPGSNLLTQALSVIAPTPATYYQNTGRTLQANGLYVDAFAAGVVLKCSVQAVDRSAYVDYNLDFQRQYITVFMRAGVVDLARDFSGDQIAYAGNRYQPIQETDWYAIDGWVQLMCVLLQADS